MENKLNDYNENSIVTLKPREAIRESIGMYIGNNDSDGMHHLMTEIIANAMDEAAAGFGNIIDITIDQETNKMIVSDHGRGIPFKMNEEGQYAVIEACTSLHSGGKFENQHNYKSALGLHGLGMTVVNALSSYFEIISTREDGNCQLEFEDGEQSFFDVSDCVNKKNTTGTTVVFIPDTEIFGNIKWDKKKICDEIQLHALLNNGLTFNVHFGKDKVETFCYQNGIKDMLDIKRGDSKPLTDSYYKRVVINEGASNEYDVEMAIQYIDAPGETIYAFTNGGYNPDMGTHVTGWKAGFTSYINKAARDDEFLTDKDENFSGDLIRRGLLLMLSVKMVDRPMFAEQTKLKLTSPEARAACSQAAGMLDMPKKILKQIIDKALVEKKADDAAKRAKEAANKIAHGGKNMNSLKDLPEKLADCPSRDGELYLVEGDSAAGNLKMRRNKQNQAVFPLRGKVLNTISKDLSDILENQEIKGIITCPGCGVGENFNIDNMRYSKVIIATDADPDGGHIELLLMTLFLYHLPQLVEAGMIYTAVSPLYKIVNRQGTKYYYTEGEARNKTGTVSRYKGLNSLTHKLLSR